MSLWSLCDFQEESTHVPSDASYVLSGHRSVPGKSPWYLTSQQTKYKHKQPPPPPSLTNTAITKSWSSLLRKYDNGCQWEEWPFSWVQLGDMNKQTKKLGQAVILSPPSSSLGHWWWMTVTFVANRWLSDENDTSYTARQPSRSSRVIYILQQERPGDPWSKTLCLSCLYRWMSLHCCSYQS